jgi:5-carboxymethyl-2-hydroxymuconate isomerase
MKLISYEIQGKPAWGVIDAADAMSPEPEMLVRQLSDLAQTTSLKAAIEAGFIGQAASHIAQAKTIRFGDLTLQKPIPDPEKIVCVGVNYANRNEEYKDNQAQAKYPSLFIRFTDSLVAHGQTIVRPPESEQLDYEGEIVVVIGKSGRRIKEADAAAHIAGLSVMNEGTIRDWLRHSKFNVTQGKNFVATGAFGPWLVTTDACPALENIDLTCDVNGEQRQKDNTQRMGFPITRLVSYISTFMQLKPGDVIATGTPTGAGARFDPPKWLVPNDRVTVSVQGVGTLSNVVADEVI